MRLLTDPIYPSQVLSLFGISSPKPPPPLSLMGDVIEEMCQHEDSVLMGMLVRGARWWDRPPDVKDVWSLFIDQPPIEHYWIGTFYTEQRHGVVEKH